MRKVKILIVVFVLAALAVPAYAAETLGGGELTLSHFEQNAQKPVAAWEQFREYKYRLDHPLPKAELNPSSIRNSQMTAEDFRKLGQKPLVAAHRSQADSHYGGYVRPPSGKPAVDARKA